MLSTQVLDITQQGANNLYNWTFPGSPYAANTPGVSSTLLLAPSVDPNIIASYNRSHASTLFFMSLPKVECTGYEDIWFEDPYINVPVVVRTGAAAVPNGGTGSVTQTFGITDATFQTVAINHKLFYPDNVTHGIVTTIAGDAGSYTVTVTSYEGQSLPAVVAGDELGNSGPRFGDGQPIPTSSFRSNVVRFSNTMEQLGNFATRWDPMDAVRWDNQGTTNYKANEIKKVQSKYFTAIMQTILTGGGGRITLNGGRFSLATKGIMPQLTNAAVGVTPVTTADFLSAMREAVHDNQVEDETNDWILIGSGRILDKIGAAEKSERLRYQVGDKLYDTSITKYDYWGHSVTPIRVNNMEDVGMYGKNLGNRVILIRKNQLKLTYMKNWPMFSMQYKLANNENTSPVTGFANLESVWYNAMFGVRVEKAWSAAMFDVLN